MLSRSPPLSWTWIIESLRAEERLGELFKGTYKISNYKTIELDNSENMKQGNHFELLAAQLIKKKNLGEFQKILWFIFLIFCYFISSQFKIEGTSRSIECFFEKK